MLSPRHELQIHFDGDMAGGESQFGQQLRNRGAAGDLPWLAVEQDRHELAGQFQMRLLQANRNHWVVIEECYLGRTMDSWRY
jgi:hypothetical protein